MIATIGKVIEQPGSLTIQTARPDSENLSDTVTVLWQDCRTISPEQRRKAWALIGEIAAATGYIGQGDKSDLNTMLKAEFLRARIDKLQAEAIKAFSLSDVDMTTARLYIDWLVEFCVINDIPTKQPLVEYAEDIGAYIYACVLHKQCAVCGRRPTSLGARRHGRRPHGNQSYRAAVRTALPCTSHRVPHDGTGGVRREVPHSARQNRRKNS